VTFVDGGNGTGQLAGTPASGSAGTYPVTITAADGVAADATKTLTIR
jgi:Putative Ig domain